MKKILALALALIMVLALAACGGGNETPDPSGSGTTDPGASQQEQENPDSSAPAESGAPDSTDAPDNDAETVEGFLKIYGWTEDDIKPEHFVSFGDLEMDGSTPAGESGSMGYITISVDKDATTQEDINAWFEQIYAKMTAQSADGKLYKNLALSAEADSLQELMEGVLWEDLPGGSCYYPCKLDTGDMKMFVSARYKIDEGEYKISIGVQ